MSAYHLWGTISSAFFLSSIPAIGHQLITIWRRKRLRDRGELHEQATHSISLNQVLSSYWAVYSFFLFGFVLDSPDPFLTYPRAVVGILLYWVTCEICFERGSRATRLALCASTVSLVVPLVLVVTGTRANQVVRSSSHILVCLATVVMAQGAYAQYRLLRTNRARGAVSLPMHSTLYLKDLSGMIFGLQIGASAWSIIAMHLVNVIMRAPIIFLYLRLPKR
jgi:hypothetical protein